jgi:hypothetical protein
MSNIDQNSNFIFVIFSLGIFLSIFQNLRFENVNFTLSDALFTICILWVFVFYKANKLDSRTKLYLTILAASVFLLLVGLALSSIVNGDPNYCLKVGSQYVYSYLLLPITFFVIVKNKRQLFYIAKIFIFALNALILLGFFYGFFDPSMVYTGSGRFTSFLENPGVLSKLISLTVPILLWVFLSKKINFIYLILSFVVYFAGLILSSSFAGFISTFLSIFVFLMLNKKSFNLTLIVSGTFFVLLSISNVESWPFPEVFQKRIIPIVAGYSDISDAGSYSLRIELFEEAENQIINSPLIGRGTDQHRGFNKVHSTPILLWVEGGFLSILGWIGINLLVFMLSLFSLKRQGRNKDGALCLSVFLTFCFVSFTYPHLYSRYWVIPLCITLISAFPIFIQAKGSGSKENSLEILVK